VDRHGRRLTRVRHRGVPGRLLVAAALGAEPSTLPVVTEDIAVYDQANLQLALDRWVADGPGRRSIEAHGLAAPGLRYMAWNLPIW
jgi:hypothetical protein